MHPLDPIRLRDLSPEARREERLLRLAERGGVTPIRWSDGWHGERGGKAPFHTFRIPGVRDPQ